MALDPVPEGYVLRRIIATYDPDNNEWHYVGLYKDNTTTTGAVIPVQVVHVTPEDAATPELQQNALTAALNALIS